MSMPFLFLSPSTQTYNAYVTTGNEQYWMNQLADAMEPYLRANAINFTRNDRNGSAAQSIRDSNAGSYDFHLALHSNASPPSSSGRMRGIDAYYYPMSADGLRMANIIVDNLKYLYPLPDRVRALPTTVIGEVRRTKAPSVLVELGYHDNVEDEAWLTQNLDAIARALVQSLTEYFGTPYLGFEDPRECSVCLDSGVLNLRNLPETDSAILAQIPNGTPITIYGEFDNWYTIGYGELLGFVRREYICTRSPR